MASTVLAAAFISGSAFAQIVTLPNGGQVIAGQATIGTSNGTTTVIEQSSDKAIINWNGFSIGEGGTVQFNNGSGATLNRVTGGSLSSIDGLLSATGSVYLINPNGVIIGKSGVINVGGTFVASTLDITNNDFLNSGDDAFSGTSLASVVNLGKIGALGGDVTLMAAIVRNDGTLSAQGGTAGLLAGTSILMRDTTLDDGRFLVLKGGKDTSVTNIGAIEAAAAELRAEGGSIYALAGNTEGLIRATGVTSKDGKIYLTAGEGGSVTLSGSTLAVADAAGNGGTVSVTGQTITVAADATIDVSATATLGNGGTAKVIADMTDGTLTFAGAANAKGGTQGGDGGLVETSGASVDFNGARMNTSAAYGATGNWLVDPFNLTIDATAAATISSNLATTDVTLQTTASGTSGPGTASSGDGDIIINSDISWGAGNRLTLDAYHSININASITVNGSGGVTLLTNNGGTGGDYSFALGKSLSYTGTGGSLNINGDSYHLLYSMTDLVGISGVTGKYALAHSLDASGTSYADAVVQYLASGSIFTGLGNTINDLNVNGSSVYTGLFSANGGTIRNIGLVGGSVTGSLSAGALVGYNQGDILGSYSTGSVTGSANVGGLVGLNDGTITSSFAAGAVTGSIYIGGLTGRNLSTITESYATGSVTGSGYVGGLVGFGPIGTISSSYATGYVSGADDVGGLVGYNGATITDSYYDSQTTGMSDTGKGTPLTTTQFQSGTLPTGFDSSVWSTGNGLYPYLTRFYPNGAQAISGTATTASGGSAAGAQVGIYAGGALLGGTSSTGANGYYYALFAPGTYTGGTPVGATLTLENATTVSGVTYTDSPILTGGNVTGLDITSGLFSISTQDSSATAMLASMASTFDTSTFNTILTLPVNTKIVAGSNYTVDYSFDFNGDLLLQANGDITIASNGTIGSEGSGDAITIAANGAFINSAGASALTTPHGRWLIYTQAQNNATDAATGNELGGLEGTNYYGDAFDFAAGTFASTVNSGNRFVTGYHPTLTVNGDTTTVVYNGAIQSATYSLSGYLGQDATTDTLTGSVNGLSSTSKNVGVYSLSTSGTLVSDENYQIVYGTAGTLTINPAALTLAAATSTKVYDGTTSSTGTVNISGLQGTDSVSGATQSYGSKNVLGAGVSMLSVNGSYVINDGNGGNNYTVTTQTATGTITPAALTLAAVTDSKTYDGTTTSDGSVSILGLVGTDTVSGLTQAYDSRNAGSRNLSVGGYTVNDGNGGGNYSVTLVTASGMIDRAALTLSAEDIAKIYGATDPLLTYGITSGHLFGDDSLSGSLSRASGEDAGTYAIGQGSLSASSNYDVTFVGATFTITGTEPPVVPPVEPPVDEPVTGMQNEPVSNPISSTGQTIRPPSVFGDNLSASATVSVNGKPETTERDTCVISEKCVNQPYPTNRNISSTILFAGQ